MAASHHDLVVIFWVAMCVTGKYGETVSIKTKEELEQIAAPHVFPIGKIMATEIARQIGGEERRFHRCF